MSDTETSAETHDDRVFLVVVDDTEEMKVALRFACRRAAHTGGRVALLYVVESSEFQHWMSVGDLMREEARKSPNKPDRCRSSTCARALGAAS